MKFEVAAIVVSIASVLLQLSAPQPLAPASAPQSISAARCRMCPVGLASEGRSINMSILVETDVAQFYAYTLEGAMLVYFAARVTFSHAPAQLRLDDFHVKNEISILVQQGATTDCYGREFPAASTSSTSRNGPVGSMYVPNLSYTAVGPITNAATNFIRLAFSEPVVSLDISNFDITLSQAPSQPGASPPAGKRRLQQAAATPAQSSACVPAYQAQVLPAVRNSTQFYNVFITLPDCFYGLVRVGFTGQVSNLEGAGSLPVRPVGFNRISTYIPVDASTAFETLPALGQSLGGVCSG